MAKLTDRPREIVANNPVLTLLSTAIATAVMSGVGVEQLGGGADAKAGISDIIAMSEDIVEAANAERDRALEDRAGATAAYMECIAERIRELDHDHTP